MGHPDLVRIAAAPFRPVIDEAEPEWYTHFEVFFMLCQKCHKSLATVRYAEVIDGKVTDLNVCPECLTRLQSGVSGFELAGTAPSPKRLSISREEAAAPAIVCRTCGVELQRALRTNRVGCASCYDTFAEALEPVLRGTHGALRHRGKTPHVNDRREQVRAQLQTKRALLRSILKMEKYEEAAVLRDEIKALEEALGADNGQD
jgi:protein arginine kinase activator